MTTNKHKKYIYSIKDMKSQRKGVGFYDKFPAGRDTKNLIIGILATVFDRFG